MARRLREGFDVDVGPEWELVEAALREVDATLPAEFRRKLRETVKPLVREAQGNIQSMPVRGRPRGLRQRISRSVRAQVTSGGVRVTAQMSNPDEAVLPRGFDRDGGFRHPVFGNQAVWVRQFSTRPGWFSEPLAHGRDNVERDLQNVLEDAVDRIAEAGGPF